MEFCKKREGAEMILHRVYEVRISNEDKVKTDLDAIDSQQFLELHEAAASLSEVGDFGPLYLARFKDNGSYTWDEEPEANYGEDVDIIYGPVEYDITEFVPYLEKLQ